MVRFIFICMSIVALSIVTIAAQSMVSGIQTAGQSIEARNSQAQDSDTVAALAPAAREQTAEIATPEALNDIQTAAGADTTGNDTFGKAFTETAPEALSEEPAPASAIVQPGQTQGAN